MRYSNPDRLRQFIQRIPQYLDRLDYNAIKIDCNSYLPSIPIAVVDFTNDNFFFKQREWGGINVIFRARQITNPENRPHETISDISYIPDHLKHDKIKQFGRVNKPSESMFYGSLNSATACTEAISKGNVF